MFSIFNSIKEQIEPSTIILFVLAIISLLMVYVARLLKKENKL